MITRWVSFCALACVLTLVSCNNDNSVSDQNHPTISLMKPAEATAGQADVTAHIIGTNFTGIVVVDLGPGIDMKHTTLMSPTKIEVVFSVRPDATPGPRQVMVTSTSGTGESDTVFSIGNNVLPVASFTLSPLSAGENAPINFDASGSTDSDGTVQSYDWDFGDGATGSGKTVTHSYTSAGTFTVTLTVTDNSGGKASSTKTVEIQNSVAPVAHYNVTPQSGNTSTKFAFDGSDSKDADGHIVEYKWYFSDTHRTEGKKVTHQFTRPGTYPVELVVTDNSGLKGSVEKNIVVSGEPPVASFSISPSSGSQSTNFTFDASSSHDPAGTIAQYAWDFDDGTTGNGQIVKHQFAADGTYHVQLTVTDNSGLAASTENSVSVGSSGGCQHPVILSPSSSCSGYNNIQSFRITQVISPQNPTIIVSSQVLHLCPGHQCEARRPHTGGYAEYLGDVQSLDACGTTVTLDQVAPLSTHYSPPTAGEDAYIVCK
ncbi:MAG: hypothetical protein C5B54_08965 [Acidobacteria bacterium]|nr:MAG: hypothetical protein C5B54_08965 [Acidobacteriota bacterium]